MGEVEVETGEEQEEVVETCEEEVEEEDGVRASRVAF